MTTEPRTRTPLATWAPKSAKARHKCQGACGRMLPATKYPTIHTKAGIRRGGECRACRDLRTGRRSA